MAIEHKLIFTREAGLSDLPFLLKLRIDTMDEHLKAQGIHYRAEHHLERLLDQFKCSKLICYQTKRIGLIKVKQSRDRIHLMQLQISPSFQGQGIGSYLVKELIRVAMNSKCRLSLKVLKLNPAKALYQRLGFIVTAESNIDFEMVYQANQLA